MLSQYVRELSVGDMVRGSIRLYGKSFVPSVLSYLIPELPGALLITYGYVRNSPALIGVAELVLLAGGLFAYTGITICISDACIGNKPSLVRALRRSWALLGRLTLTNLLQFSIVLLGMIALIVPGVIFGLWFLYAPVAVVLEGRRGWPALKRSRELAKGFNLRNLGVMVLACLLMTPLFLVGFGALGVLGVILRQAGVGMPTTSAIGSVGGMLIGVLVYPLFFVLLVLTYYDLRARKEGYDPLTLAAELGR